MKIPGLYPEDVRALSRYEYIALRDRVNDYRRAGYTVTWSYKYAGLWRVGIWQANGQLVRFYYAFLARVILTIWFAPFTKNKNGSDQAAQKSTKTQRNRTTVRPRSQGKREKGGSGGNQR